MAIQVNTTFDWEMQSGRISNAITGTLSRHADASVHFTMSAKMRLYSNRTLYQLSVGQSMEGLL
jgi:hypothetical protein